MTNSRARASGMEAIGTYRVLRLLGRGGMGEVYLAWTGLRLVAIKVLNLQHAHNGEFVKMFLAEARIAARINHSGIAQVLDVGMDGGRLYMVMEYVAGHTLDELLRDPAIPGLLPLRITTAMFANVAHALATAHRAGVIHRDISPHNLLVSDTGAVKIIDFGIAHTGGGDVHTSPGTFRGRFGYMAPEYVQGQPCDHRVDLFALGVVMWEAFARQRLYAGAAAAQLFTMIQQPAERLDSILPGFPMALADMVARLLQRDPALRYSSAGEVADQLSELLPALPEDGFRSLEHWVSHHLHARIEERMRTDREELQRIAGDEAVRRLSSTELPMVVRTVTPLKVTFQVEKERDATGPGGTLRGMRAYPPGGDDEPSIVIERPGTMGGAGAVERAIPIERSAPMERAFPLDRSGSGVVEQTFAGDRSGPMQRPELNAAGLPTVPILMSMPMPSSLLPPPQQPAPPGLGRLLMTTLSGRQGIVMVAAMAAMVVVLSVVLGLRGEWRARKGEWRARQAQKELVESKAKLEQTEELVGKALEQKGGSGAVAQRSAEERAQASSAGSAEEPEQPEQTRGAVGEGEEMAAGRGAETATGPASGTGTGSGAGSASGSASAPGSVIKAREREGSVHGVRPRPDPRLKGTGRIALQSGGKQGARPDAARAALSAADAPAPYSLAPGASNQWDPVVSAPSPSSPPSPPASPGPTGSAHLTSPTLLPLAKPPLPDAGAPARRALPPPTAASANGPPQPTPTPRVPATLPGNATQGAAVVSRCNTCHRGKGSKLVEEWRKTSDQWERYFRNGYHDRKLGLGDSFSVSELANAKAFLMKQALDASSSSDQSAGSRP